MKTPTGTIMNYYFHCQRQCYLHANRINLEDNSEDVRIGKILHELEDKKGGDREISIDNVRIDKITKDYLVEVKKSDSDPEAVKWQVLLYLYKLKQKGVLKKGKIEFIEKRKQNKKVHLIELDENNEKELLMVLQNIENLINQDKPPSAVLDKKCKKCAYYEYCFI